MNEMPKSKHGWPILRRILISMAILATVIAIFYTEEDWRGKRAWENCKRELEAKGVVLDWDKYIPPPVPDDQNFFKAPIFGGLFNGSWSQKDLMWIRKTGVSDRLTMSIRGTDSSGAPPTSGGYWLKGTTTDLGPWQQYYRALAAKTDEFPVPPQPQSPARDVLLALSRYNSTLEALRQAGRRPYSRPPLDYENPLEMSGEMLPVLADMKGCAQVLELRTIAELQNGESEKALDDILLMLRLDNAIRNQPYLIVNLVHIAITSITIQPIYEGLAKHQWTDAQLEELEQALGDLNFLTDFQFTARGESAFVIEHLEYYRQHPQVLGRAYFIMAREGVEGKVGGYSRAACVYLMPVGWFYQNELAVAEIQHRLDSKTMDSEQGLVFPQVIDSASNAAAQRHRWPWSSLAWENLPATTATARKSARIQVEVDLALTACALERYRLTHGRYPESLDALTPQFINKVPHDIFGGKLLRYRRMTDDNFVLYSIGWNETDDGGVFSYPPGSQFPLFEQGDWVWQSQPK